MSSRAWSDKGTLRRLRDVIASVPGAGIGGSTQSTAFTGIASYSRDMTAIMPIIPCVLNAIVAAPPHPVYGDDGYRDDLREDALDALEWAEEWVKYRNERNWNSDTVMPGERPWKKDP